MRKVRGKNEKCEIVQFLVDNAGFQPRTLTQTLVKAGKKSTHCALRSTTQHVMTKFYQCVDRIVKKTTTTTIYVNLINDWTSNTEVKLPVLH